MQPRRQSYGDDEDIIVKPSTELIADEYEHSVKSTNNIAVHTLASKSDQDQDNIKLFVETLNKNSYQIKSENTHCLDTDNIWDIIDKIRKHIQQLDGLILYFSGACRKGGTGNENEGTLEAFNGENIVPVKIQDIWNKFTSSECLALKNKPKIFIFHVTSPTTVETDSRKFRRLEKAITYDLAYETPAEADILIVYHKTETSYQTEFTDQLCENINVFGRNEDIISLVTCTESIAFETPRPMIISTLTRKFYFTVSEYRGLHLFIDQNHKRLREDLKEVDEKLLQVNKKPQRIRRHLGTITTVNTVNKHSEVLERVISKEKVTSIKGSSDIPDSKKSNAALPAISKNTKSRKISLTKSEGGKTRKTIENRPPWRF